MGMNRNIRMTLSTLLVLRSFLDHPGQAMCGADIHRATGMPSGALYPILRRLEKAGWAVSAWEDWVPATGGRPARRFYNLTPGGKQAAAERFAALAPARAAIVGG
jgi:PadR family transcriptional regulator PadR